MVQDYIQDLLQFPNSAYLSTFSAVNCVMAQRSIPYVAEKSFAELQHSFFSYIAKGRSGTISKKALQWPSYHLMQSSSSLPKVFFKAQKSWKSRNAFGGPLLQMKSWQQKCIYLVPPETRLDASVIITGQLQLCLSLRFLDTGWIVVILLSVFAESKPQKHWQLLCLLDGFQNSTNVFIYLSQVSHLVQLSGLCFCCSWSICCFGSESFHDQSRDSSGSSFIASSAAMETRPRQPLQQC